jgi:hypothetical protein
MQGDGNLVVGWNAIGGDYTSLILGQPRASWCAYFCSQDSRCQRFTYVPPGIQNVQAVCWLKDSAVTWVADQSDGNLVLTYGISTLAPYWSTGTAGYGGYARMQGDGNFVIYNCITTATHHYGIRAPRART